MLQQTQQTPAFLGLYEALISAGAQKEKAKAATKKILETLPKQTTAVEENGLDLSHPNDAATKKDLKILDLQIGQKIAEIKSDLEQKIIESQNKLEQKIAEIKSDLEQKIIKSQNKLEQKMAEIKSELEQKIAETRSALELKIAEMKSDLIKWVFGIVLTGMTISTALTFALAKFL